MLIFLVMAVVATLVLVRACVEGGTDGARRWARARGLDLAPESEGTVRWYLRRGRVARTGGALAGLLLVGAAFAALGRGETGGAEVAGAFVGYLLGALYAELSLVRPGHARTRSASLVPRRLADYLPPELRRTQRALAVVVAVGALALAVVPVGVRTPWAPVPWWVSVGGAVAVLALAAGLEGLQGWLLRRPQPLTSPALLRADDAIRAQSVQSISGSAIALLLVALGLVSLRLAQSDVQVLRWTMWAVGFFALSAALFACQYYGHQPWSVCRLPPPPPPQRQASV